MNRLPRLLLALALSLAVSCSDPTPFADAGPLDMAPPLDLAGPELGSDLRPPDAALPDMPGPDLGWPAGCPVAFKGLSGQALKAAVFKTISGHNSLGYTKARDAIFLSKGGGIDLVGGQVECVYTGRKSKVIGDQIPSDMNVEHSWPKSKGADKAPANSDLHHLFPADAKANSRRGNNPFGEADCGDCGCSWTQGGSTLGYRSGCDQLVFEVRPSRGGDIARAQFYFALRYMHLTADAIPVREELALRAWHAKDAVDAIERKRNAAIEALQKNRNPLVDCPLLVDLISDF